jgi:hypothetical protein
MIESHAASEQTALTQTLPQTAARAELRAERALVAALIALILLIVTIPTLAAYASSPPDRRFQGIVYGVADTAQYFSWLRDHRDAWLVSNRMTAEPNRPALFNLLWLAIGRIQAATDLATPLLFHAVRLVAGAALLATLYATCARFTLSRAERLSAFLVTALGAGLGWIWVVAKYVQGLPDVPFPFDLYVAEPNTLFILMAFPHFTIATTLILGIFLCFLAALRRRSVALVTLAALLGILLTLQHAYDLLIITLVPAGALALMFLRDRRIPWFGGLALLAIGLVALPPPLYFTWLTSRDPLWREVLDQFANAGVFTPPPHHLLILMGLPLLLVLVAIATTLLTGRGRRELAARFGAASDEDLFLWSWLLVGFLLLYVPTDFQIHMLTAWQVPVGIVAVRWLHRTLMPGMAHVQPRLARALPTLLLVAVLPTSLYVLAWRVIDLRRFEAPYWLGVGEVQALEWLGTSATADDVVLSGLTLGQFVPVYSDARTVLGHWAQTAHFYDKSDMVVRFFDPIVADTERATIIAQHGVRYLLHGLEERELGDYDPAASPLFEPAYSAEGIVVYRVR